MSPAVALAEALAARGAGEARLALVLGSGLGGLAERVANARAIPYEELEGMPASTVPGHAGRLVLGELAGVPVVVQQGRVHLYEGRSVEEVTRAVRAFAALGVPGLVLTNAAGGLESDWEIPSLMRITDHVNLQPSQPAARAHRRASDRGGMETGTSAVRAGVYHDGMGAALDLAAKEAGISLYHGIYAGLLGPSYETAAEVRMLRWAGAQAVGMSTVAEATAAHCAGMRVCALSCVTNHAAGISAQPLSHDEVVAAGAQVVERLAALLEAASPRLAACCKVSAPRGSRRRSRRDP